MNKIHCIFEKADEAIVDAIRKHGDVIQWDYTFGAGMRFLASTDIVPDIIIASEFASTGKKEDLFEYIDIMKQNAREAKIVIVLSPERARDREFLFRMDKTGVEYYPIEDIYPTDIKKWTAIKRNDSDIKVLFAANMEELEEPLRVIKGIDSIETVFEREVLVDAVERRNPDIVLLSPRLPGNMDLIDIAWELKRTDTCVIFLADKIDPHDLTIQRIREQGVEDIIFGMPKIGEIEDIIKKAKRRTLKRSDKIFETDTEDEKSYEQNKVKGSLFSKAINNLPSMPKVNVSVPKINIDKINIQRTKKLIRRKGISKLQNVIGVFSPNSSGKTFVSTNLAAAFSNMGMKAALLDATKNLGIHTWFNIPLEECGLSKALKEPVNVLDFAFRPKLQNLEVLTQDPGIGKVSFQAKQLEKVVIDLSESCDVVIIDIGLDMESDEAFQIIKVCTALLIVGDPDYHHSVNLQITLDDLIDKEVIDISDFYTVYNRYVEGIKVPTSDVEAATGMSIRWTIPDAAREVYESIRHGVPAYMFSLEIKNSFVRMAQEILEILRSGEGYGMVL